MKIITKAMIEMDSYEAEVIRDFHHAINALCQSYPSCDGCPLEDWKDNNLADDCVTVTTGLLEALKIKN